MFINLNLPFFIKEVRSSNNKKMNKKVENTENANKEDQFFKDFCTIVTKYPAFASYCEYYLELINKSLVSIFLRRYKKVQQRNKLLSINIDTFTDDDLKKILSTKKDEELKNYRQNYKTIDDWLKEKDKDNNYANYNNFKNGKIFDSYLGFFTTLYNFSFYSNTENSEDNINRKARANDFINDIKLNYLLYFPTSIKPASPDSKASLFMELFVKKQASKQQDTQNNQDNYNEIVEKYKKEIDEEYKKYLDEMHAIPIKETDESFRKIHKVFKEVRHFFAHPEKKGEKEFKKYLTKYIVYMFCMLPNELNQLFIDKTYSFFKKNKDTNIKANAHRAYLNNINHVVKFLKSQYMKYLISEYTSKANASKKHVRSANKITQKEHDLLVKEKNLRIHYINGYNNKPGKAREPKDWYQAYEKYKQDDAMFIERNYKSAFKFKQQWYFIGGQTTVNTIRKYLLGNKDTTTHKFSYIVKFYFTSLELGAVMRSFIKQIESKQELDGDIKNLRDNLFHSNFWFIDYTTYNKDTKLYEYSNVFIIIQEEIENLFASSEANKMLNEFNSAVNAILQRLKLPIKNGEIIKNLNYKMHKCDTSQENDKNYVLVKIANRLIKQLYEYENSKQCKKNE